MRISRTKKLPIVFPETMKPETPTTKAGDPRIHQGTHHPVGLWRGEGDAPNRDDLSDDYVADLIDKGTLVPVDEDIAPLVLALWEAGFETCSSCQAVEPGWAYVSFNQAPQGRRFLEACRRVDRAASAIRHTPDELQVLEACGLDECWSVSFRSKYIDKITKRVSR